MNWKQIELILARTLLAGFFAIGVAVPLVFTNSFFFPFMVPRTLLFRGAVEILFLLWLVLAWRAPQYRLRWTRVVGLFTAYVVAVCISTALSITPRISFWGDFERGDGLVLSLHLWAFLVMLASVMQTRAHWLWLFRVQITAGWVLSAYALAQWMELPFAVNTQGIRLSSTIGNPGFLATVLLLYIGLALMVAGFSERSVRARYWASAVVFGLVVVLTATRGAILALGVGALVYAGYAIWSARFRWVRVGAASLFVVVVGSFAAIWMFPNSSVVQSSESLRRMAAISLTETTVQTRLLTWKIAVRGIWDNPVFGAGPERFQVVFNRYFDPAFVEEAGSIVWFDRAHNGVLDQAVSVGLVGVGLFLATFAFALVALLRAWRRDPEHSDANAGLLVLFAMYAVQGMFIFDIVVSYVVLMSILGFCAWLESSERRVGTATVYASAGLVFAVLLPFIFLNVVVRPAQAAYWASQSFKAQAIIPKVSEEDQGVYINRAHQGLWKAIRYGTYGNQELRIHLAQFIDGMIVNDYFNKLFLGQAVVAINQELLYQLEEDPDNVANVILLMRHYNFAYPINSDLVRRVTELEDRAVALSPQRAQIYQETAKAWAVLSRSALDVGDTAKSAEYFATAEAKLNRVLELNPDVVDFYIDGTEMYFAAGNGAGAAQLLERARARGLQVDTPKALHRVSVYARRSGQLAEAILYLQRLNEVQPNTLSTLMDLALANALLGERSEAIAIANVILEHFPEQDQAVRFFIRQVEAGEFEQPK